jgi:hypothetical protein
MNRNTRRTVAPNPLFPERGRQEYGEIIAQPKVNADGVRAGDRWAQEGLDALYSRPFAEAHADARSGASHQSFDAVIGGQADGRTALGGIDPPPVWDVDAASMAGFWQGTDGSEISVTAKPPPFAQRAGANPSTITSLAGLRAGERPGNVVQVAIAPPQGGRGRVNVADRTEL